MATADEASLSADLSNWTKIWLAWLTTWAFVKIRLPAITTPEPVTS